jgi:hypothetical protein
LRRAPAISECPADNGESCKDQDQGESDVGQREDRAIGDALSQLGWLSEVIGHKYGLAVSWHQRMDRSEQHSGSHRSEYGLGLAASDLTEATRHPAIEPVLDRD